MLRIMHGNGRDCLETDVDGTSHARRPQPRKGCLRSDASRLRKLKNLPNPYRCARARAHLYICAGTRTFAFGRAPNGSFAPNGAGRRRHMPVTSLTNHHHSTAAFMYRYEHCVYIISICECWRQPLSTTSPLRHLNLLLHRTGFLVCQADPSGRVHGVSAFTHGVLKSAISQH